MKPVVITSKKANEHFDKIKARHADILTSLQAHKERVTTYNEQRKLEMKENENIQQQRMKEKEESMRKQKELELKQAALI